MGKSGIFYYFSKTIDWVWVCLTTGLKGKRVKARSGSGLLVWALGGLLGLVITLDFLLDLWC